MSKYTPAVPLRCIRRVLFVGEGIAMPTLSLFHGITIQMYWSERPLPHFHAFAEGNVVALDIRTLETLQGHLSAKKMALVLEWAQLHQGELMEAWELCSKLQSPQTITPLP